jgi:hypothetical protein
MSPLAAASLLVNEEMAHPAHEVSLWGVPIRGTLEAEGSEEVDIGIAVSGSVRPYLRIR